MTTGNLPDGNLWLHFTRTQDWVGEQPRVPVLERGEGCVVWDTEGRRYLDGLSALFCAQLGYGRRELVDAATRQMETLAFGTNWGYAHQPAIDLAAALAERFPGDLDHAFFVNSGSEAVETAMKLAIQYHRLRGEHRWKFVSRTLAYHGTTFGALGLTGLPSFRAPFEPLRPGNFHAPVTNPSRCAVSPACPPCDLSCANAIEQLVLAEGPDQIAAVVVEPVQNAGGCLTPPPGYLDEVRRICDEYGILMISDEVICAFGRLGTWTGAERYGYLPDLVTFAKGVTSAYQPMGGVMFRRHLGEVLGGEPETMFLHGATWGGHPVAAAVALANLEVFESEDVLGNVQRNGAWFGAQLDELAERHEMVADVRGEGYFWAMELARDPAAGVPFDAEEAQRLVREVLGPWVLEHGLICRVDNRERPVVQFAPPLIADREVLGEMLAIVDAGLTEAAARM